MTNLNSIKKTIAGEDLKVSAEDLQVSSSDES